MKNENSQGNLTILLLGTGGTIAGLLEDGLQATPNRAYKAAQLPVEALIPASKDSASKHCIVSEQIAQIDSKDMSFALWEKLHSRIAAAQNDPAIHAIVITHGTDTLEETAYFLHATLCCTKPVILTGAMRPADSLQSDGPGNLAAAIEAASHLQAGVWTVFAGETLGAVGLEKKHPQRLAAFGLRAGVDDHPIHQPQCAGIAFKPMKRWPRVEVVLNYAGSSGKLIEALVQQGVDGIVVAATGNGTVSEAMQEALFAASSAGVAVRLCTRCPEGAVSSQGEHPFEVSALSPVQARVDLLLQLGYQLNLDTST